VAFLTAAAGKVRTRVHLAAAEGGNVVGPAAVGGVKMAAAVVVHALIRTSVYIAIATSAAGRKANSGALAANKVRGTG
jgi:hypothetical protein